MVCASTSYGSWYLNTTCKFHTFLTTLLAVNLLSDKVHLGVVVTVFDILVTTLDQQRVI